MHTIRDVWRDVDKTNELHFLSTRLNDLGNLVGDNATVRVTRKGVGSVGLDLLHRVSVAADHLGHGGEHGLTLIEATGTEGVEGAFSVEILRQVDEDQHFTDTWVNEEDGGLVTGSLERNDRVVDVGIRGRGVEDLVDQGGEEVWGWVQQDAEDGDFVRKLHGHLDFTLEPIAYETIRNACAYLSLSLPDHINARSTHFEKVVLSGHASNVQAEDALEDIADLLRDRTFGSLDELLVTTQLQ